MIKDKRLTIDGCEDGAAVGPTLDDGAGAGTGAARAGAAAGRGAALGGAVDIMLIRRKKIYIIYKYQYCII